MSGVVKGQRRPGNVVDPSGPRLFLSRDEWEKLSERLEDPFFRRVFDNCLEALRLLDEQKGRDITDVPRVLGTSAPHRVSPARVLKNRLQRSAVAWYVTKEQRHLDFAAETLEYACLKMEWRIKPWRGLRAADLHTGDLLYVAAFGLDVLGPYLSVAQEEVLVAALRDKGLAAYLDGVRLHDWWRHADFNWGTALHGNAGMAALAIQPYEPELAERVLAEAKDGIRYAIENFPAGGGWIEGIMYQSTTVGHLTDFVVPLYRLRGDDLGLLTNPNFHDSLTYRIYMTGGDGRPLNFSNSNERSLEWPLPHAYWWAQELARPDWAYFEDLHPKDWRDVHGLFHDTETFWYRVPHQKTALPELDRLRHFQGLDWVTWHGPKTWLAFRSGFGGGNHGNWDLGHFILGRGRERFLVDPGYGAQQTARHNAVTIRHRDQTDCATATIFRLRELENGFYLVCDLQPAYPHSLSVYRRHLLLIDDEHLLVLDDFTGRHGHRTTAKWHLQTRLPHEWRPGRPDPADAGATQDGELVVRGEEAEMVVSFLAPIRFFEAKEWEWHGSAVTTFSWREDWDHVHSIHPVLLSFTAERAECTVELDCFTLTVGSSTYRIDLAEGSIERPQPGSLRPAPPAPD